VSVATGACGAGEPDAVVRPGIEVLVEDSLGLIEGLRVGLITNQSGVARDGRSSIDVLRDHRVVDLRALFSPEHGIRGTAAEGARLGNEIDVETGLPVYSLYGESLSPTSEMLEDIDVLLFDLQDIGARYFTYVSTMAYAMRAAGEAGLRFVVLDRPNPIGGQMGGPILDPHFASFVGLFPVPTRHGMTAGELARMYVGEFGIDVDLSVVPVDGWTRDEWFDETGLPWIPPSPNMPDLESASHYPGTCLFEGTNLSVGRGTPAAFQQFGAPWLDGPALAAKLSALGPPGVRITAVEFTPDAPSDGKFPGERVSGVRLVVTDRARYDPVETAVAALIEARSVAGEAWVWNEEHIDRLAGSDRLRLAIDAGASLEEIVGPWAADLAGFDRRRAPYLIY